MRITERNIIRIAIEIVFLIGSGLMRIVIAILLSIYICILHRETGVLGSGAFGTVCKGVWMNKAGHEEEVAIKKIEDRASEEDKIHFLQEAAILGQFSHPNIVSIVGVVINTCKETVS